MTYLTVTFQIYAQKQKRVKIVSVGPDGQCHELAKSYIPQGKIKDLFAVEITRMHSSRMHTARSSSRPGGSPPGISPPGEDTPLLTESQTPVKILPCLNFVAGGDKYSLRFIYIERIERILSVIFVTAQCEHYIGFSINQSVSDVTFGPV